jgi:hypothetical protein
MLYTEHAKTDDERRKVDRHKVFHRVMEHAMGSRASYYKSEDLARKV